MNGALQSSQWEVFADPAQSDETFNDGRPQVRMVRRFSIVPSQAGSLRITGPRMAWWDVRAGVARTASLPDIVVQVRPGVNELGATPPATAARSERDATEHPDAGIHVPGIHGELQPWALAAMLFAALWLITLMWGMQRRQASTHDSSIPESAASPSAAASLPDLKRALKEGGLGDVAQVLCAMCRPPASDLDALRLRLDDARQIAAVEALQRARWGHGDGVAARILLRDAFRDGPRWHQAQRVAVEIVPPLYPRD